MSKTALQQRSQENQLAIAKVEDIRDAGVAPLEGTLFEKIYNELLERSQRDPEWFWDAVVEQLGLVFNTPYQRVVDVGRHEDAARPHRLDQCGQTEIAAECDQGAEQDLPRGAGHDAASCRTRSHAAKAW